MFDTVTLIISDSEARGPDSCCHGEAPPPPVPLHGTLPVYDLNITVLPVNDKVPAVTLGKIHQIHKNHVYSLHNSLIHYVTRTHLLDLCE